MLPFHLLALACLGQEDLGSLFPPSHLPYLFFTWIHTQVLEFGNKSKSKSQSLYHYCEKNSSLIIIGRMYSHQMVLAPQVDLVVQVVQGCLFLENLVNQSDQEVLVVPHHLWIMIRKCSICRQMGIDYLRQVSQISAVPFTP